MRLANPDRRRSGGHAAVAVAGAAQGGAGERRPAAGSRALVRTWHGVRAARPGRCAKSRALPASRSARVRRSNGPRRREPLDFFDLKSDVAALLQLAGSGVHWEWRSRRARLPASWAASPPCTATARQLVGWANCILRWPLELGFTAPCMLFELDITRGIAGPVCRSCRRSRAIPHVRRDLSITVPLETPLSAILSRVSVAAGSRLRELVAFDVYQGPGIEPTRKSIAFGLIFQDNNTTLTDADADALMASVAADLGAHLDARIR